ncbi:hypothetical protein HPP92_009975 [Vanilla planifolia]|uniref:Uncharacterized protein n=1 Tax=Vanilla planifolia TaxID=51239 RepID=A0A835R368_VANPL|nr:hypothetical protein HPP92_009975 [Vanilla planifolia]
MPSSPTFSNVSCLTGGSGGTYRFDLEILAKASSPSPRSINSSLHQLSPSQATPLCLHLHEESSGSSKQPNNALPRPLLSSLQSSQNLHPRQWQSSFRMGSSPQSYNPYRLEPVRYQFQEPGSPVSMQNPFSTRKSRKALTASWKPFHEPQSKAKENNCNHHISNTDYLTNPHLASVMAFGLGGAFAISSNIRRALKQSDLEWWKSPPVAVEDIVPSPKIKASLVKGQSSEKKKKKKSGEKKKQRRRRSIPQILHRKVALLRHRSPEA